MRVAVAGKKMACCWRRKNAKSKVKDVGSGVGCGERKPPPFASGKGKEGESREKAVLDRDGVEPMFEEKKETVA